MSMLHPEVPGGAAPEPKPKPVWLWLMITVICLGAALGLGVDAVYSYGTRLGEVVATLALLFLALGAAWTVTAYHDDPRPSPRQRAWMQLGWSVAVVLAALVTGFAMVWQQVHGPGGSLVAGVVAIKLAALIAPAAAVAAWRACRRLVAETAV